MKNSKYIKDDLSMKYYVTTKTICPECNEMFIRRKKPSKRKGSIDYFLETCPACGFTFKDSIMLRSIPRKKGVA